jgi:hypothetical protein
MATGPLLASSWVMKEKSLTRWLAINTIVITNARRIQPVHTTHGQVTRYNKIWVSDRDNVLYFKAKIREDVKFTRQDVSTTITLMYILRAY